MMFVRWEREQILEACLEALATGCIRGVPLEDEAEAAELDRWRSEVHWLV